MNEDRNFSSDLSSEECFMVSNCEYFLKLIFEDDHAKEDSIKTTGNTSSVLSQPTTSDNGTKSVNDNCEVERKGHQFKPMNRDDFLKRYSKCLTAQELFEVQFTKTVYCFGRGIRKQSFYSDRKGYYVTVPNDHINFRFELINELGYGTFASVVKAYDRKSERYVAIKIFREGFKYYCCATKERAFFRCFEVEEGDDSRCVVKLYEFFSFRLHACLTFELLDDNLSYLIRNNKEGIDIDIIKTIIECVLKGLDYLHTHSIIHGDLKPSNVARISKQNYRYKIVDLGLARFTCETKDYPIREARSYRAPEIILRASYGCKIDIFSLGLITFEMVTGKRMLYAPSDIEQIYKYVEVSGLPPRHILEESPVSDSFFRITPDEISLYSILGARNYKPKAMKIENTLGDVDQLFIDFLYKPFEMDPRSRLSAAALLSHPWINNVSSTLPSC